MPTNADNVAVLNFKLVLKCSSYGHHACNIQHKIIRVMMDIHTYTYNQHLGRKTCMYVAMHHGRV